MAAKTQLLDAKLSEQTAERVRVSHQKAIKELQQTTMVDALVIKDVELANATATPIAHRLGRPAVVLVSPPRGATTSGRIVETRSSTYDRSKVVVLTATGFGATIAVDLVVL